jgi:hypothetical protein
MKLNVRFSKSFYLGAVTTRLKTGISRTLSSSQSRIRVAVKPALSKSQDRDTLRNTLICALPFSVTELEDFGGNSISEPNTYQSALLHRVPLKRHATLPDVVITLPSGQIEWWELK